MGQGGLDQVYLAVVTKVSGRGLSPADSVLSSALALETVRPAAETERTMKENAYEGTWLERTEKPEGLGAMI